MSTWLWIVIAIVVLAVVVAAVSSMIGRRRTERLRQGFGPEYDRTVESTGDQATAEAELRDRQRRHDELDLRPLAPEARRRVRGRVARHPGRVRGCADVRDRRRGSSDPVRDA